MRTLRIHIILLFTAVSVTAWSQTNVYNKGVTVTMNGVNITGVHNYTNMVDSLTQSDDGEVVSNDTLQISGSLWNRAGNEVFTTNGAIVLRGDSVQEIKGDSSFRFYQLVVDKPAGSVLLQQHVPVANRLRFEQSHLDLNGFNLNLSQTGFLENEHENSRVVGATGAVTATRFINSPSLSADIAGLGLALGSSGNFSFTDIERYNIDQTGAGDGSIERYWAFAPTNTSVPVNDIQLRYFQADLDSTPEEELTYWQSNTGGTVWNNNGGSADTSDNVVSASGFSLSHSLLTLSRGDCSTNPIIGWPDTIHLCPGDSTVLNANNAGHFYDWSTGDSTQWVTVSDSGIYTVTVTSVYGCVSADTVFVDPAPVPTASFGLNFVCLGDTVFLSNSSGISDSSALTYAWDFGDSTTAADTSLLVDPYYVYGADGSYQVTLVATSQYGCFDSSTANVFVHPYPQVNFGFGNACEDTVITFTDSTYLPSIYSVSSRLWDFGDDSTSTMTSPTHSYDSTGTYFVKQIVTSNAGCTDSLTQAVVVFPNPTASFSVVDACEGTAIAISDSSSVSSGTLSYLWDLGDSTSSTQSAPVKVYAQDSTYTIALLVTTNQGCTASDTQSVIVNDAPLAGFTLDSACLSDTVHFFNSSSVANATLGSAWSFGDNTTSAQENPTKTYANAGTYTVKLVVTSQYGCADSVSHTTEVYPMPVAAFNATSECLGTPTALYNTSSISSGSMSYLWDFGSTTSTTFHAQHAFTTSGTHPVTLTATSSHGCQDSVTSSVSVFANPAVNLGGNVATCGSTFLLDAGNAGSSFAWSSLASTQTYLVTTDGTYAVTVTDNNGCVEADTAHVLLNTMPSTDLGPDTSNCGSYVLDAFSNGASYTWSNSATGSSIAVAVSGQYWVEVTDQNNCVSADTVNVTILPVPVIGLGSDTAFCSGNDHTLDAGNSGSSYAWNTSATTQTINVSSTGNYRVTVTNASGCVASDTIHVTVNPTPVVDLGPDTSYCGSQSLGAGINNVSYAWNTTDTTAFIMVTTSGTYALTATNAFGCSDADTADITVNTPPVVSLGSDTALCQGGSLTLAPTSSTALIAYLWTNSSTDSSRTVSATGNYSITASDANGCTGSDTVGVTFRANPDPDLGDDIILCLGDTAYMSTGQPGWQHQWGASNNASDSANVFVISDSAMVWVSVTDSFGCTGMDSVHVTKLQDTLRARFLLSSTVEVGDTVHFIQLSYPDPLNYHWNFGDGGTSTDSNASHIYFLQDTFNVTLVAYNASCADTLTKQIIIAPPSSNSKPLPVDSTEVIRSVFKSMVMYPNPTSGVITLKVELNEEEASGYITCYTLQGHPIRFDQFNGDRYTKTYDFSRLAAGMYLMQVRVKDEQRTWKFIKL